jgi:SagB-type dehydrogenase family enzyme
VREFSNQPLSLDEIGQLLWSAQGLTDPAGLRTVPSAGALYPLETHVVVGKVSETQVGVYRYVPGRHELVREVGGDKRHDLAMAALQQSWMEAASIMVIFTIVGRRITAEYGRRGLRTHRLRSAMLRRIWRFRRYRSEWVRQWWVHSMMRR